jgi:hypothetical protein
MSVDLGDSAEEYPSHGCSESGGRIVWHPYGPPGDVLIRPDE